MVWILCTNGRIKVRCKVTLQFEIVRENFPNPNKGGSNINGVGREIP